MWPLVIYVGISEDKEGAGLGVERQEADCRGLAEQRGYRVVDVDTDVGGGTRPPPEECQEMSPRPFAK